MSEQKNGSSKPIGQVLVILALMSGFTAIFIPIKQYVEEQAELRKQVKECERRLTVIETRQEAYQVWPPTVSK